MTQAMRLEGKVAIITGAGAGQGREASLLFAREGARVVAVDIRPEAAEDITAEIQRAGGEPWRSPATWQSRRPTDRCVQRAGRSHLSVRGRACVLRLLHPPPRRVHLQSTRDHGPAVPHQYVSLETTPRSGSRHCRAFTGVRVSDHNDFGVECRARSWFRRREIPLIRKRRCPTLTRLFHQ